MSRPPLSKRISTLPRSAIRQIMALANSIEGVIHLEVGEPFEATDQAVIADAFERARGGATKYVSNAGDMELRRLIAERHSQRTSRTVPPERVIVTTGAVGALFTALMATVEPGTELLVPDPGWPNYRSIGSLAGGTCIPYRLYPEQGFEPDLDELEALITPATRAILINTPGNPTGGVFREATVKAIVELARRKNLHVVSDEIYEDIVFDGRHCSAGEFGADDNIWIVSGVSKSFAMTGWRVGWLILPDYASDSAILLQEPVVSCISAPSQAAAISALKNHPEIPEQLRRSYAARRDIVVRELGGSGILLAIPKGGYYAMLDISSTGLSPTEAATALIRDHKVALVPGDAFGASSASDLRLAFTPREDLLVEGCRRILRWVRDDRGAAGK